LALMLGRLTTKSCSDENGQISLRKLIDEKANQRKPPRVAK